MLNFLKLTLNLAVLSSSVWLGTSQELGIGVYETQSQMDMEWISNATEPFSTENLFQIEQATSTYLMDALTDPTLSALPEGSTVLRANVNIRSKSSNNGILMLESVVRVIHSGGRGLTDLAGLLNFATSRDEFALLDERLGTNNEVLMVTFVNEKESILLSNINGSLGDSLGGSLAERTNSEITLIIVCAGLSFALLVVSIILIWVAGGWLSLRKQIKILIHREEELTRMSMQLKETKTMPSSDEEDTKDGKDGDDADADATQFTNPSGILGVKSSYQGGPNALDGLGIKMTPSRRKGENDESEIYTPMSEGTAFSDSNRAPLGITSMRKLLPPASEGQDSNALENFRIEKLSY